MIPKIPAKTFFKIGEVANLVGVKPHVIRYWESEFRRIRTTKTKTGQRLFQRREIFYLTAIRILIHDHKFTVAGARDRLEELIAQLGDPESVLNAVVSSALPVADVSAPLLTASSLADDAVATSTAGEGVLRDEATSPRLSSDSDDDESQRSLCQLSFDSLEGVDSAAFAADGTELFSRPRADLVARIRVLESELGVAFSERGQLITRLDGVTEALEDTRAELATQQVRVTQSEDAYQGELRRLRDQLALAHQGLHQERSRSEALFKELEESRARITEKSAHKIVLEARLREVEEELHETRQRVLAGPSERELADLQARQAHADALGVAFEELKTRLGERLEQAPELQRQMDSLREENEILQELLEEEASAKRDAQLHEAQARDALAASVEAQSSAESSLAALQTRFDERASLYITAQGEMMAQAQRAEEAESALEAVRAELETARGELTTALGELETARFDHELMTEAQSSAESSLAALQTRFDERASLYITAQGEMMAQAQRAEEAESALEAVRAELEMARVELETARGELETARGELETARGELAAEREASVDRIAQLERVLKEERDLLELQQMEFDDIQKSEVELLRLEHKKVLEVELERVAELSADKIALEQEMVRVRRENAQKIADDEREMMALQRHVFEEKQRLHKVESGLRGVVEQMRRRQLEIARTPAGKR